MSSLSKSAPLELTIDRLKKIEALASFGVEGERDNARRMLAELCRRHRIAPEQLAAADRTWVHFSVKDAQDDLLLAQVIAHICRTRKVRNKSVNRRRWFELTTAQAIDARLCFAHYRKLWRKNLEDVMIAFIHANTITCPSEDDEKHVPDQETMQKAQKILSLMHGMKSDPWKKRLQLCHT